MFVKKSLYTKMTDTNIDTHLKKTAHYTLQKYAAAVAIAVIKIKPENVSTYHFCEELRKHFENLNMNQDALSEKQIPNENSVQIFSDSWDIFTESQPIDSDTMQIFNSFKSSLDLNSNQQLTPKIITEFDVIQSRNIVNNAINMISGLNSFEQSDCSNHNNTRNLISQDSGYQSSMDTYQRKKLDLTTLDKALSTLTSFLSNLSIKTLDKTIVELISKEFGKAIDVLYKKNIYLKFYDNVVDTLDNYLKNLQDAQHLKAIEIDDILLKFCLFNESGLIIHHTLSIILNELEHITDKVLNKCSHIDAVEIKQPTIFDYLFYLLYLYQLTLKKRNHYLVSNKTTTQTLEYVQDETADIFQDEELNTKCKNLLSKIILECSESYPLVAFWAMECHNIYIHSK